MQSVHKDLTAEADKIGQHAQEQMQAIAQKSNDILKPLDDEILELVRKDGAVITVSLKERLDFYRKLIAKEEKSLVELSRELAKVQKEIDDFAVEVFGAAGAKILRHVQDGKVPRLESAEQKQIEDEVEREQKHCLDAVAKLGEEAIKEMKGAEKVSTFSTALHEPTNKDVTFIGAEDQTPAKNPAILQHAR